MEKEYKAIIFGKDIYQEIELYEESDVKIGTTQECTIRFDRTLFFDDFEINIRKNQDQWKMICGDNIYIAGEGVIKHYITNLVDGDEVFIKYQNGNTELFSITFLVDYDRQEKDYRRIIDLEQLENVSIGLDEDCDINLKSYIGKDDIPEGTYIYLVIKEHSYKIINMNLTYPVYVNGFCINKKEENLEDYDFFLYMGCNFYIKDKKLYTTSKLNVNDIKLRSTEIQMQNNRMEYPKFQRNTRIHTVIPNEKIEVQSPKEKPKKSDKNIFMSLMPALLSVILMVGLRGMMGGNSKFVIYSGAMMSMGLITSVVTFIEQSKKYKKDTKKREEVYTDYVQKREEFIKQKRKEEKEALDYTYISTTKEIEQVQNFDSRLFEKSKQDQDYLTLYIGRGKLKARCEVGYKESDFKETEDPLEEYPKLLHDSYYYLDDVPVTIDLKETNSIGIIGEKSNQYELLKNFTLDLVTRQFYEDVKLFYIFNKQDIHQFTWMRWLKNTRCMSNTCRNFMYDEDSKKIIIELLYKQLSFRETLSKEEVDMLPNYIVFVYSMEDIEKHPISKYIKDCNQYGFTFVFFNEYQELIPMGCDRFIYSEEGKGELINTHNKSENTEFTYEIIPNEVAESVSKKLGCVYVDTTSLESKLTNKISLYKLLNIQGVEDLDITQRWDSSKVYESMAAPFGVRSNNTIVYLDLNEKYHGPHGLVAGTTGSGKSEILQTYILSMATLFHPYEVGFVIIDFKGGGMVNQFRDLPHLIGSITNIDGREIDRSLLSIRAELKKRQELFAKNNVNHIDAYIKLFKKDPTMVPLPHLILIVDEFAELKSSNPEFMKELISTARIGRSLGVHLILATQKPSGVVDEQIWSNSKFKLCLKVQNKQDSNEVIKSPLAAEIKEPGRAYLQVGNNEIFELFQSAFSGADINADKMGNVKDFKIFKLDLCGQKEIVYEQKNKKKKDSNTQLEAIVEYLNQYCNEKNIKRLPGICLPSLSSLINYRFETRISEVPTDIGVSLGIYDDPSNQLQDVFYTNITQNNTFILGSSQYGKTNLLQVILKGLSMRYSPKEVNIYILDFASMILKSFENLKHVGGVILASDDEKIKNFFDMMHQEIEKRKKILSEAGLSSFSAYKDSGYDDLAQIVILVDNITALKELYLSNEDYMLPICRDGLSVGISVVFTNQQMSGMGYKYLSNFSNRIALFCNDSNESSSLFGHSKIKVQNIPGRGICEIDKNIYEFQSFLAFQGKKEIDRVKSVKEFIQEVNQNYDSYARKIPVIPDILDEKLVYTQYLEEPLEPYSVMMGLDYSNIMPFVINLCKSNLYAISSRDGNDKKNLLEYIIKTLNNRRIENPVEVVIYDDMRMELESLNQYDIVKGIVMDSNNIVQSIEESVQKLSDRYLQVFGCKNTQYLDKEPLLLFIINNNEVMNQICNNKECYTNYDIIYKKYAGMKVCFIYSNLDNVPIPFTANNIMKQIKSTNRYIVFEEASKIRFLDISLSVAKQYKNALRFNEGYHVDDKGFSKIKFVKINK